MLKPKQRRFNDNYKVAVNVMGWQLGAVEKHKKRCWVDKDNNLVMFQEAWTPTTCSAQMMMIVERMRDEFKLGLRLECVVGIHGGPQYFSAGFVSYGGKRWGDTQAQTAEDAVVVSALATAKQIVRDCGSFRRYWKFIGVKAPS